MTPQLRFVWLGGVIVVVALVGTWRAFAPAASRHGVEIDRSVRQVKRTLDRLGPATPISDTAAVEALVNQAPVEGSNRDSGASIEPVRALSVELVSMRFGQSSPLAYRAWRAAHGSVWTPLDYLSRVWGMREDYEKRFGRPYPDNPQQLFDDYWATPCELGESANRIVGVLTQPGTSQIVRGTILAANPLDPPLAGVLGAEVWEGQISSTMCPHWQPPRGREELLREHGWADVALVGVISVASDGSRRPMVMCFLWDPSASRWFLEHLRFTNENVPFCGLSY